ncbi:MAG: hypothetical protein JXR60_11345 [Bacteroidales bacterium]|nr:hypothetical protein [Bacteroidales bacterium]
MINAIKTIVLLLLIVFVAASCEEDFSTVTEYNDKTVVYAFLEHKDPWNSSKDTNFIVVNKAFLGEANVYDMASVADSVNYPDYDQIDVSLQRIKTSDPNSEAIGDPIQLDYTVHYKDSGVFSREHNVVFYTTKALMYYQDVDANPAPGDESYYYRLSVKKPNKEEVYAVTKMIRGIYEGKPMTRPDDKKEINMVSTLQNYKFNIEFKPNLDATSYALRIRLFYYEKKYNDDNIYLDYVDYTHSLYNVVSGESSSSSSLSIGVPPSAFYINIASKLKDTTGVQWRMYKTEGNTGFPETHAILFTLGSYETYMHNQVTQPSNGIVQERPTYSNIVNGLGLFTSKWNFIRDGFYLSNPTIDSLSMGEESKYLKFKNSDLTVHDNYMMDYSSVIKRY